VGDVLVAVTETVYRRLFLLIVAAAIVVVLRPIAPAWLVASIFVVLCLPLMLHIAVSRIGAFLFELFATTHPSSEANRRITRIALASVLEEFIHVIVITMVLVQIVG
jgi:hypothetical protein